MCGGNGKGFANVCLVSLGTGLGFAMATEGNVLMTPTGSPLVSIWNLPYNGGILEDYASKRGFYNTWEIVTGSRPSEDMTVAEMGRLAGEGDQTALEVFRKVGEFIGKNIKGHLTEYKTECLLFGGQISRSFRFMEEAVKKELSDIEGLDIRTVSDFSNAAFKGLVEMLKAI
jgi:glucokinase